MSENSVEKLKSIKHSKVIADTINLLISKYREYENGECVDILSKLTGYLLFDLLDEEDIDILFNRAEPIEDKTKAFEELTTVINTVKEKITAVYQENKNN